MTIPTFTLQTGAKIPALAFGVGTKWYKYESGDFDNKIVEGAELAIEKGYTHLDTAEMYRTERELGEAIKKSGVKRESLFVTTKLAPGSGSDVRAHFEESLKKLDLDYVDLYLIHFPGKNNVVQQWKEMEKIYESGKAKAVGVSNFRVTDLEAILKESKLKPAINQIEFHPYMQEQTPGIVEFCKKNDILLSAYSSLTPIARAKGGPVDPVLEELSKKYNKLPMQILLRWTYQNGLIPITTSGNPERLVQAQQFFDFELSKEDEQLISTAGSKYEYRNFWEVEF